MSATTLNLFDAAYLVQTESPSITPETFGPVTRWFDANSFSLANDAIISSAFPWDDQSPNDDDAFSTLGHEPTFHTNAINGRPVVRFTGADHMQFEGGDLELVGDFTILCIGLTASDSTYLGRNGFNRQVRINRSGETRASWFSGNSGSELISQLFLSNAALPRMIGHRRTLGEGLFTFFDNATAVMPTTGGVNPGSFGINEIGTLAEFTPGIIMDIAELVIYNKSLLDSEIQALYYQYFKPKFALP